MDHRRGWRARGRSTLSKQLEQANHTLDEANDRVYRLQKLIDDARWAGRLERKLSRSVKALRQVDELTVVLARCIATLRC